MLMIRTRRLPSGRSASARPRYGHGRGASTLRVNRLRAVVVERFESALWQTSSLLLAEGTEAVLVDPAVSADEVARIAARARELGADVTHVLATHADWDHVAGSRRSPLQSRR